MSKARTLNGGRLNVERIEEQNLDFEALQVGAPNYFWFSDCQTLLAEQGGARSRHTPGEQVREVNRSQPIASIHSSSSVVLYYSKTRDWVQWKCVRWKFFTQTVGVTMKRRYHVETVSSCCFHRRLATFLFRYIHRVKNIKHLRLSFPDWNT